MKGTINSDFLQFNEIYIFSRITSLEFLFTVGGHEVLLLSTIFVMCRHLSTKIIELKSGFLKQFYKMKLSNRNVIKNIGVGVFQLFTFPQILPPYQK